MATLKFFATGKPRSGGPVLGRESRIIEYIRRRMHSSSYATLARSTENVLAETSSALPPRHAGSAPCRPQFPRCRTARNTRRVTAIFGIGWTPPGRNDDVPNLGRTQSVDRKLVVVAGLQSLSDRH